MYTIAVTVDQMSALSAQLPNMMYLDAGSYDNATGVFTYTDAIRADVAQITANPNWIALGTAEAVAKLIRAEFDRRIASAFGNKRASMNSYHGTLNARMIDGETLTADEQSARAILRECDDWEGDMVDKREALIASVDRTFASDAHWPPQPVGLTTAWLAGY